MKGQDDIEKKKESNTTMLNEKIDEEKEKLQEQIKLVDKPLLLDPKTPFKPALDELYRMKKASDKVQDKIQNLRNYEAILEVKDEAEIEELNIFN